MSLSIISKLEAGVALKYANTLLYPSLADQPNLGVVRRIYVGSGWLLPFPSADASDEVLAAFARAIVDPWGLRPEAYLSLARPDHDDHEGVMYVPVRWAGDFLSVPWRQWDAPKELLEETGCPAPYGKEPE